MSEILKEAFKELQSLKEDTFSFDKEGIFNLDKFLKFDDIAPDTVSVIDPAAESEDQLQSSYEGDVILKCCVCSQLLYKNPTDVIIDQDLQRANVEEDCPHCGCAGGYEIVGQVTPYVDVKSTEVKIDDQPIDVHSEEPIEELEESKPLEESVEDKPSIANYFKDVDEGEGWVTLEYAEEALERSEDEIADWLDKHPTVGYIYNIEDIQVICTPHAPSFDSIAAELGIIEDVEKEEDESLTEDFHKATVETGDSTLSMETDENGKITVTSEPRKAEEGEEMITPVTDEVKAEIESANAEEPEEDLPAEEASLEDSEPAKEETPTETATEDELDLDLDEVDENSFSELGESYFHKVYDNVKGFQLTGGSVDGDKILLEGVITFNSGKQAKTRFLFEGYAFNKSGKLKFIGENAQISKRKNAFALQGRVEGKKLITESFTYNYRAKDAKTGKNCTLYGTVKTKR